MRAGSFVALIGASVVLTGCGPELTLHTAPEPTTSRAQITAAPATSAPVSPREPLTVAVTDGRLVDVTVTGPDGPLAGTLTADGTTWTSEGASLGYGASYAVHAEAIDARGVPATTDATWTTTEPKKYFDAQVVSPRPGEFAGVGMPITVHFDRKVKDRAAVESALVVRTTIPINGAWAWTDAQTAVYRPETYWPGNMTVHVDFDGVGVQAAPGVYGKADHTTVLGYGPSMVTKVNALKHTAKVYRDGTLIRTIPITTGKEGFETRSGVKVIMTRERSRVMDAATTGTATDSSEYYRLNVQYAMRLTNTGEFVHAAPWSVRSQGYANVSHGCIGMSLDNANWLFEQSSIGDVVEVTGTNNIQDLGNGITVWNEPWDQWLAKSATGAHATPSF